MLLLKINYEYYNVVSLSLSGSVYSSLFGETKRPVGLRASGSNRRQRVSIGRNSTLKDLRQLAHFLFRL